MTHHPQHRSKLPQEPILFAPPPRSNASPTSMAAAEQLAGKPRVLTGMRLRILQLLNHSQAWRMGATHEEISRASGIRLDTVKPRVHELGEMGLVKALRQTRNGRLVFVAAEHVGGRELEPWPVPRPDWRSRAINAERRAAEAEAEVQRLERRLAAQGVCT